MQFPHIYKFILSIQYLFYEFHVYKNIITKIYVYVQISAEFYMERSSV